MTTSRTNVDLSVFEVFFKYLPSCATEQELTELFKEYKPIGDARLLKDNSGACKGVGWLSFSCEEDMKAAMAWDGFPWQGKHVQMSRAGGGKGYTLGVRGTTQEFGTHTPAMKNQVMEKLFDETSQWRTISAHQYRSGGSSNGSGVGGSSNCARDTVRHGDGGRIYVDGTFGRGGHSKAILEKMGPKDTLHGFDLDPEAVAMGRKLAQDDPRFRIHHAKFSDMEAVLKASDVRRGDVDGVFLDLGISSPQLDSENRGFRPEAAGPLDLRFDSSNGVPASKLLSLLSRSQLERILIDGGEDDEIAARRIADAVALTNAMKRRRQGKAEMKKKDKKKKKKKKKEKKNGDSSGRNESKKRRRDEDDDDDDDDDDDTDAFEETREFARLVSASKGHVDYQAHHAAKMSVQALRIHVNEEYAELRKGLEAASRMIAVGGKIVVLTWKFKECSILNGFYREREAVKADNPYLVFLTSVKPDFEQEMYDKAKRKKKKLTKKREEKKLHDDGDAEEDGRGGVDRDCPDSDARASATFLQGLAMDEATRPSRTEIATNSRSRSAILHCIRKTDRITIRSCEKEVYKFMKWGKVAARCSE